MDLTPSPDTYDEAVRELLARTAVRSAVFYKMASRAARRAFTISQLTNLTLMQSVLDALGRAVANGTSLDDFKRDVSAVLKNAWKGSVANPAWRIELIFRNGVQTAYSRQRVAALSDPLTARVRPYWVFQGIRDQRQSRVCKSCNGVCLPANHPWWRNHTPPLHHACRSGIRAVTKRQAERLGITAVPPGVSADAGFGDSDPPDTKIDWSRFDPELANTVAQVKQSDSTLATLLRPLLRKHP